MRTPEEFDEIRPYDPEELPTVIEELIADPEFRAAAEAVLAASATPLAICAAISASACAITPSSCGLAVFCT